MSTVHVRSKFQPTAPTEVPEREAAVLEQQGLLFDGSAEQLAAHYRAAGLDLPPDLAPASKTTPAAGTTASTEPKEKA